MFKTLFKVCLLMTLMTVVTSHRDLSWHKNLQDRYDYIVVGAGTSGSVFARKAAADGNTVLLLEQGGDSSSGPLNPSDPSDTRIPKNAPVASEDKVFRTLTTAQSNIGNTVTNVQYGKLLGGGSAVSAMINIRGDFNDYAEFPPNWNSNIMLQAFKRIENATNVVGATNNNRGFNGPYPLDNSNLFLDGLPQSVITGAVALGLPNRVDLNDDFSPYGAGLIQPQIVDGERRDAYQSFVKDSNWYIEQKITTVTQAFVKRIMFKGDLDFVEPEPYMARGVVFTKPDVQGCQHQYVVKARKGVVLAAGAIETPILLEKSGIGSAERLASFGITPILVNEDVGENFKDHLGYTMVFITTPSPYTNFTFLASQASEYVVSQTGIFASPGVNALVFLKELNTTVVNGAIQMVQGSTFDQVSPQGTVTLMVVQTYNLDPKSVGSVHFSGVPGSPYLVDPNYGAEVEDLELMAQIAQRTRQIMFSTGRVFGQINIVTGQVISDPNYLETPAELAQTLSSGTYLGIPYSGTHFTGSASLGKVVNPNTMRVFGNDKHGQEQQIKKLFVVDASVIPVIPKANTVLPVMAVAERASQIILN